MGDLEGWMTSSKSESKTNEDAKRGRGIFHSMV